MRRGTDSCNVSLDQYRNHQGRSIQKENLSMRGIRLISFAALTAALCTAALPAWAQNNTNNTNNANNNGGGAGNLPAGVIISTDGILRVTQITDRTGELTRTRLAESRARLGAAAAKGSPLRKISLQRLEAAIAERLSSGKEPTDEMKALAGLTRLQYVFYYPETKDIVIAGPAEGVFQDFAGRLLARWQTDTRNSCLHRSDAGRPGPHAGVLAVHSSHSR
jgi:hypothetical protein